MQQDIPVYSCDHELIGFWTPEQVERAFAERYLLRVIRQRSGKLVRAYRKQLPGEQKAITRIKQGTASVYKERLPRICKAVWAMKRVHENGGLVHA